MTSGNTRTIRRIIYCSRATDSSLVDILRVSRANNGIDGVTGILIASEDRFLQILEGPPESVTATFDRIFKDDRHTDIQVLSVTDAQERAFGGWTMADLLDEDHTVVRGRLMQLIARLPEAVRAHFDGV